MEKSILLQTFAVDKEGVVRSVEEVSRGLACECLCPACGERVIARQGEIREWHFAHSSGGDCAAAAETALHLAAKQALVEAKGIMLPEVTRGVTLKGEGGLIIGTATRPATWVDFLEVEAEKPLGAIKPDIYAVLGGSILLVEVAVTHFVDDAKRQTIIQHQLPCVEVDLSRIERATWTWEQIREAVVDGVALKSWVWALDQNILDSQAMADAQRQAVATPVRSKPRRRRYKVEGRIVDLVSLPFGMAVWTPYDPHINEILKGLARRGQGQFQKNFKNWLFPVAAESWLEAELLLLAKADPMEI